MSQELRGGHLFELCFEQSLFESDLFLFGFFEFFINWSVFNLMVSMSCGVYSILDRFELILQQLLWGFVVQGIENQRFLGFYGLETIRDKTWGKDHFVVGLGFSPVVFSCELWSWLSQSKRVGWSKGLTCF